MPGPGKARKLDVRLRREGLRVSHRSSYVLATGSGAPASEAAAAEAIAKGFSGGRLGLSLATLSYLDRDDAPCVTVVLQLDGPSLAAAKSGPLLPVQVYGYSLSEGRVIDSLELTTTLDLAKAGDRLRGDGFRVLSALRVAEGAADLRFFARAGTADLTGSIRRVVGMPSIRTGEWLVLPPVFVVPAGDKIAAVVESQRQPSLEVPYRIGGEAFLPDPTPILEPGRPREICLFVRPPAGMGARSIEVTGSLERPQEPSLPVDIEALNVVTDQDGFDRHVLRVVAPRSPAGRYALRLTLDVPGSGQRETSELPVTLR
jgi:hypothetical protein